jgi:hypothetical protein
MSNAKSKVLTVTVDKTVYNSLKMLIADGKVSEFVNNTLKKAIKEIEEEIKKDYYEDTYDKKLSQEMES